MVMLEARPPSLRQTGSSQEKIATVMLGGIFLNPFTGRDRLADAAADMASGDGGIRPKKKRIFFNQNRQKRLG
jgi:hypothetical protein